ncbi:sorbosone dehydrogenase family protein [Geobacter sp. DSM 9736]|uniref:PQQ-dependent sugar dehydrogenase n=1 Tax=Geobacter sp. DSM 9736 TaxID=1277350 RepID=UPI000B512B71|nr:PQQ-dependent sugar dehydrogenase [Geobacter sp. DSM 9736]SNB44673.1 Glucose/arabinose dehydrogenase, beta-propeller fold [Geobacter sp. DSM 9736]
MRALTSVAGITMLCISLSGCFGMRPSAGGGKITELPEMGERALNPADIALPEGYAIEAVATGLTFPTGVTFDESGMPYVVEAGYSYGEVWEVPRLLRVDGGKLVPVAEGRKNGPWTGVVRHEGAFYVAEGGELEGGRILRITADGNMSTVAGNFPTRGDHHTNGPAVGPDGWLYFGLGTATNSGIVGEDNLKFGWLARNPDFHDTPCIDVTLTGENYETKDVVKGEGEAFTGAFVPFGKPTSKGEVIKGNIPCNGAVLKVLPSGGSPELVAWGFRNPFGLAFSPEGKLFVTDNGYDERGSRPVFGTGDALWEVQQGIWYGWPDFSTGLRLDEGTQFKQLLGGKPKLLLEKYPNIPPKPAAILPVHSSADGFDFSRSEHFGHVGEAFVAQFGDQSPTTGKVVGPVGFNVVRVDVKNGVVREFVSNKGKKNGPASGLGTGGIERPVAARFDPSGKALYIVDFGILKETPEGAKPVQKTGVLWRITREVHRDR